MAQTFNAFLAEFAREAGLRNITERPYRLHIEAEEPFLELKSTRLFEVYKWRNASIIRFVHSRHDESEASSKQFIVDTIHSQCIALPSRHHGAVVIGNIGLHIDSLPVMDLADRMNKFISFLGDLRRLTTNIPHQHPQEQQHAHYELQQEQEHEKNEQQHDLAIYVAFMETLPQHFDSVDGSYVLWKQATAGYSNSKRQYQPNSWDPQHPLYHCRIVDDAKKSITSSIAHFIIHNNNNEESKIGYIETFKYFNAFPRMHYSYCKEDIRTVLLDCTHICSFAPPMWMPIWSQLEKFIMSSGKKG